LLTALGSVLGARVLGRVLGALSGVLLARALGPADFGLFAGALAMVTLVTPLLQGALDNAALRALAAPHGGGDRLLRAMMGARVWLGVALTLLMALAGLALSAPLVTALLAANAAAMSLEGAVQTWWVAREKQSRAALADVVRSLLWLGAAAAVYVTGTGTVAAAATRAMATTLLVVATFWAVRREVDWRPTLDHQREVLRQSLVWLASGIFFAIYQQADRLMLVWMSGETEAGHYAAAANLVMVFYMVPGIFTSVLLPRMYRQAGDLGRQGRMLELRLGSGILLAMLIVPLLIGLRRELLGFLYGASYASAAPVLAWLGGTILLRFLSVAYGDLITVAHSQRLRTIAQGAAALANVVLNLVFIPRWGGAGAAAATLCSEGLLLACYVLAVRRMGVPVQRRLLVPGTVACTGVTVAWLWQPWVGAAALVALAGAAGYGMRRILAR
jgi:O-antigen/teichoic acid export membrane protein